MEESEVAQTSGESPPNIAHYLGGIDFPADKQELVDYARGNNAEGAVIDMLEQLPDGQYGSMADVMQGVGKVE